MSSKTKIIVLRMKEIIYTAIFVGFAILLILLLVVMLHPGKDGSTGDNKPSATPTESTTSTSDTPAGAMPIQNEKANYTPGIYSASITLGNQSANVEVTVDATKITSVVLVPLNDSVATMYPLMQPTMEELAAQILEKQTLEGLEYPAGAQYTSVTLMQAVETAVEKAKTS